MKEAEHENAKKKSELSSLSSKCKTLESQSRHKDKQLTKLNKKISMLEKNMQKYVQQVGNVNQIQYGNYFFAAVSKTLYCTHDVVYKTSQDKLNVSSNYRSTSSQTSHYNRSCNGHFAKSIFAPPLERQSTTNDNNRPIYM